MSKKNKIAIFGVLIAILLLNVMTTVEVKKQSEITQKTAELILIQAKVNLIKAVRETPQTEDSIEQSNEIMSAISETAKIGRYINNDLWESLTKE